MKPALDELVVFLAATRPDWTKGQILEALTRPHVKARTWDQVAVAAVLVAADPASTSPGRIAAEGPWWRVNPVGEVPTPGPRRYVASGVVGTPPPPVWSEARDALKARHG